MILVAIPYFGVPGELVDRAITAALRQDCVVLVAGDGQCPPVSVRHDRLVIGTLPRNRGVAFTQQAMILGSPFRHYAPHGADDYTEPDHLASLAALRSAAAGSSVIWWHAAPRPKLLRSSRTFIEFGLFRTDLLRSIGGYNAAEPFGQDSVLISVLLKTSGVRLTRRPTYHKVYRADSLTHDPATRGGSALRTAVRQRNREVLLHCQSLGWGNREGIRAYRDSLVPPALRSELEDRAADVAKWLA